MGHLRKQEKNNGREGEVVMTEQEKIIATAYTGIMFVDDFGRVHEYIEQKLGRPVWTHELALPGMHEKIQNAVKDDFLQMIHEPTNGGSNEKPDYS